MNQLATIFTVISAVTFVIILKIVICNCLLRCRRSDDEDTVPILDENLMERLQEIHHTRIRARRAREPPPTFEDALINSRPVSYIDVEAPPPSYDEYLNANTTIKDVYLDYSPSVNPADVLIPMEVSSINIDIGDSLMVSESIA